MLGPAGVDVAGTFLKITEKGGWITYYIRSRGL